MKCAKNIQKLKQIHTQIKDSLSPTLLSGGNILNPCKIAIGHYRMAIEHLEPARATAFDLDRAAYLVCVRIVHQQIPHWNVSGTFRLHDCSFEVHVVDFGCIAVTQN